MRNDYHHYGLSILTGVGLAIVLMFLLMWSCGCTVSRGYEYQTRGMVGYGNNSFKPKYASYGKGLKECRKAERRGL